MTVICHRCGAPMVLRITRKYRWPNGQDKKFYGCSNFPDCNATRPCHPDGTVFGIPADKETREWRIKAHAAFDKFWKEYGYSRKSAYIMLQRIMNLKGPEAHISLFSKEQCENLIEKLKNE